MNNLYVGITDTNWVTNIKNKYIDGTLNEYINFWTPGKKEFKLLNPGELFLFKLHNKKARNETGEIIGGAYFYKYEQTDVNSAWIKYGNGNGTDSLRNMDESINGYREKNNMDTHDKVIGCIVLKNVFFFDTLINEPADWSKSIVSGKKYSLTSDTGLYLYKNVQAQLAKITNENNQHCKINYDSVNEIRILPNDKQYTFRTEEDFKYFIEHDLIERNGIYRFPKQMMQCAKNTLTLFQYDGKIRASGILIDLNREQYIDETGFEYSGYYKFDINSLHYFDSPIDSIMLKKIYPLFNSFSRSKQTIDISYIDEIVNLIENTSINQIENGLDNINLEGKERISIIKSRVNQGIFRDKLINKYHQCCLCGMNNTSLLIASHIKPWAKSNPKEKLDVNNGLLLCPNHDALFDSGFISFESNGNIIISSELTNDNYESLNIGNKMKLENANDNSLYLKYHREHILKE